VLSFKTAIVTAGASALCTLLLVSAAYARAEDATPRDFNISEQMLAEALSEFARQSQQEILFAPHLVADKRSEGVRGSYPPLVALQEILEGTGLQFSTTPSGAILIRALRLAAAPADSSESAPPAASPLELAEIVVTAQKRLERLQDVPVPVTAISGDKLLNDNQLGLQDYYTRIPGLSVTPGIQTNSTLSIRGITTGFGTNPTVGITVDDVPFGSSTIAGGGGVLPDIDPGDLAQVEVLRGPQGTLYGASSMGGLLKFGTREPFTEGISGRAQAGLSSVRNDDEPGYNVRGSVNLPLSEFAAVRLSGFTRRDAGYVDDPALDEEGVNTLEVSGGRLSALWRPFETFSLKLNALYQSSSRDGAPDVHVLPGLTDLQHGAARGTGWDDRTIEAYSAIVTARLGTVDLVALTGYNRNASSDAFDVSFLIGSPVATLDDYRATKLTQEIRLSAPLGTRAEWLLGLFYTDESSRFDQALVTLDPASGVPSSNLGYSSVPSTYEDYAAFTNFTWHLTDRLDIQLGGRGSRIEQTLGSELRVGPGGAPITLTQQVDADANVFTYLITPRLKISPELMVYARLASGYRAGGTNANVAGVPPQYDPDKTQTYELGLKGAFLDSAVSVDASLYHIDWKDIQIYAFSPQALVAYNTNGARAKSQGVELSLESRPLRGMTLATWVAWSAAELTEDLPPETVAAGSFGLSGARLPYSSRFSGSLSLDQEFPLADHITASLGASLSYVGERRGVFGATPARQSLPAYAKTDLRAAVTVDSWTANFFVTNLTDRRGVLAGGIGAFPPFAFTYIQPRTVGLSLIRTF
jgi:iron complex outermembrane receptor protein